MSKTFSGCSNGSSCYSDGCIARSRQLSCSERSEAGPRAVV